MDAIEARWSVRSSALETPEAALEKSRERRFSESESSALSSCRATDPESFWTTVRSDSSRVVRSAAESSSSSAADMRATSSSSSWIRLARSKPASLRMAVASVAPAASFVPSRAVTSMYFSALVSTVSSRMTMPLAGPPSVTSAATASAVTVVSRRERIA